MPSADKQTDELEERIKTKLGAKLTEYRQSATRMSTLSQELAALQKKFHDAEHDFNFRQQELNALSSILGEDVAQALMNAAPVQPEDPKTVNTATPGTFMRKLEEYLTPEERQEVEKRVADSVIGIVEGIRQLHGSGEERCFTRHAITGLLIENGVTIDVEDSRDTASKKGRKQGRKQVPVTHKNVDGVMSHASTLFGFGKRRGERFLREDLSVAFKEFIEKLRVKKEGRAQLEERAKPHFARYVTSCHAASPVIRFTFDGLVTALRQIADIAAIDKKMVEKFTNWAVTLGACKKTAAESFKVVDVTKMVISPPEQASTLPLQVVPVVTSPVYNSAKEMLNGANH